jgi:predicted  nucleic acid-binding Zn-ribbon protein
MKIEELENKKIKLEDLVGEVFEITRKIKYLDLMNIDIEVQGLAEDNNININYELDKVREVLNNLESAFYNLNQPFEDELKSIENKIDEINLANEYKEVI